MQTFLLKMKKMIINFIKRLSAETEPTKENPPKSDKKEVEPRYFERNTDREQRYTRK
jgi:hypothetical protein